MSHPLQQRRFRGINASAVRATKIIHLSRIGCRLRIFQRAIDEVRTLPVTPQRVAQRANLFKNRFSYISVTDESIDFKFAIQLQFAKAHHQIPLEEKWVCPEPRGAPRN